MTSWGQVKNLHLQQSSLVPKLCPPSHLQSFMLTLAPSKHNLNNRFSLADDLSRILCIRNIVQPIELEKEISKILQGTLLLHFSSFQCKDILQCFKCTDILQRSNFRIFVLHCSSPPKTKDFFLLSNYNSTMSDCLINQLKVLSSEIVLYVRSILMRAYRLTPELVL